jgi:Leucine-rich repeat (LRR) protein
MSTNNNQYGKEVKPIWKSAAQESSKITKLSGAKLKSMVSNDISACTALTLSNRGITKLEDLEGFSDVLHRVDLSSNAITRLQGFSHTPGISMLNVSKNELSGDKALEDLRYLTELRTLNISENPSIKYIRSHVAKPLQKLQGTREKQ